MWICFTVPLAIICMFLIYYMRKKPVSYGQNPKFTQERQHEQSRYINACDVATGFRQYESFPGELSFLPDWEGTPDELVIRVRKVLLVLLFLEYVERVRILVGMAYGVQARGLVNFRRVIQDLQSHLRSLLAEVQKRKLHQCFSDLLELESWWDPEEDTEDILQRIRNVRALRVSRVDELFSQYDSWKYVLQILQAVKLLWVLEGEDHKFLEEAINILTKPATGKGPIVVQPMTGTIKYV